MDFSLFYFADHRTDDGRDGYRLLLEGARFADRNGFTAVWTPERHFHEFGGIYPNPAVTGAAVAAVTSRVRIRAGSVVAPLHHPVRIAEEWSVVDNLSGGRAGVSFASGWHARDFTLGPGQYGDRRSVVLQRMDEVRRLWRGDSIPAVDGLGNETDVRTFPRPVQPELPVWLTSSGSADTFRAAGQAGAGLLTHLLGQDVGSLTEKIAQYRQAAAAADPRGWPGHVVLMVHTFVGADDDAVREIVRGPMTGYMRSSLNLILDSRDLASHAAGGLRPDEIDYLVNRSFDRYFDHDGLMGSVDKVRRTVAGFAAMGVDEVACLIDFGLPADQVLDGLEYLARVREPADAQPVAGESR